MELTDDAEQSHRRFLEESHARISAIARDGYRAHGRGAIFVFEDGILDVMAGRAATVTIEYVADGSEALLRRGGWPTEAHAMLVDDYDPATSMVILVGRRRGGRELFTYQMLFDRDDDDTVSLRSYLP
jgi:hypothetical protein